jgi:DnaJ-domain-containing protein 1
MWKRVARILRAEVDHARRSLADRFRRPRAGERYDAPPEAPRAAPPADTAHVPPDDVRQAFAALELPLTAAADDVRRAWRRLMARYHPDHHATDPERETVATELTRRLTEARDRAVAWLERREREAGRPTSKR